jgi:hypothetical protein
MLKEKDFAEGRAQRQKKRELEQNPPEDSFFGDSVI